MDKSQISFAIVLPMFNEQDCAEKAIRAIFLILDGFKNPTWIIVVNDGSRDKTGSIVEGLKAEYPRLVHLKHDKNRGYGGAVKTAMTYAANHDIDYVLFMDSDLTQDPKYIARFIPKMESGYDMIKGSRYINGGAVVGVPTSRVVISMMGNLLARLLFRLPIRDYTNGFRAIKSSLARQLVLESNGFEILMEELYQSKFITNRFCEVPYILTTRSQSQGVSSFVYRPRVFFRYLKYVFKSFLRLRPAHLK